jgi:hypothetical protein
MTSATLANPYKHHRFPGEIISLNLRGMSNGFSPRMARLPDTFDRVGIVCPRLHTV